MSDLEAIHGTRRGTRLDRLTALLIGIVAILAASLGTIDVMHRHAESHAYALATRLTGDITTRISISDRPVSFSMLAMQSAITLAIEGTSRQFVALMADRPAEQPVGEAQVNAAERLMLIASAMGSIPDASSPLDAYLIGALRATFEDLNDEVAEQHDLVELAEDARSRSSLAIMGLSLVALAGVLAGLAAILGSGRAGGVTLLVGYLAASTALLMLVLSVR